jgi:hypothetical protein
MKLLKEKYKTYDGAYKRCRFENGIARSEFNNRLKAKVYQYTVVTGDNVWRVARVCPAATNPTE